MEKASTVAGSGAQDKETDRLAKQLLEDYTPEQLAHKLAQHLMPLKDPNERHPREKPLEEPRLGFNRAQNKTYRLTERDLQQIIKSALTDFGIKVVKIALSEKGRFLSKKANNSRHEGNRHISARAMVDWEAWQGAKNGKKVASRFAAERCDVYGVDEATIRKWIRKYNAEKGSRLPSHS